MLVPSVTSLLLMHAWSFATQPASSESVKYVEGAEVASKIRTGDPIIDAIMDSEVASEVAALGLHELACKTDRERCRFAVHAAIACGRTWALPVLRQAGADLSERLYCEDLAGEGRGLWALCSLVSNATMPWWDLTSRQGIPVHPLYLATMYGSLDALQFLTTKGILDTSKSGRVGWDVTTMIEIGEQSASDVRLRQNMINVAHVACLYKQVDILKWAVQQAPSLIAEIDPMGRLPLHWCASEASSAGLQVLIDAGRGTTTPWMQFEQRDYAGLTAQGILQELLDQAVTNSEAARSLELLKREGRMANAEL